MSEYQVVAFRAVDRPVSEENLEFMEGQSSRAEITPWSFDNEYQYGDFRGNALEMLRRGYDLHLHYANFGTRDLLIRLPNGLPDEKAAKPYLSKDSLRFVKDNQGDGGTLRIEPYHEPGDLDDLWELGDLIDRLVPLRAEILDGDLRPLYLAHLVIACDGNHDPEETKEGPVPAGLGKLTDAQQALAELYGIGDALITAAAQTNPVDAARLDSRSMHANWLKGQSQATKDEWLAAWLADPHSPVRADILGAFRKSRSAPTWPTVESNRTIAELHLAAEEIARETDRKSAAAAARERAKRLIAMAADPNKTLRETERLVAERSTESYRQIATLFSDLREALAGGKQSNLAEEQARKLKSKNPTLRLLVSELRRKGFP